MPRRSHRMNILLNNQDELRAGWKFAAYWLLFFIMLLAISLAVPFPGATNQLERLILSTIPTIPAIGALVLMARFVERAPVARFGVTIHQGWARDWTVGIVIAAGMLGLGTAGNATFGGITMNWTATDATTRSLIVTPIVLLMSAAQEELVFRGYPLQVLMKGIGIWPAIWTMSIALDRKST